MKDAPLEVKIGVVRGMLQKMFRDSSHFSICDFDKLMDLLGIIPPAETDKMLRTLHCVSWKDMEPAVRKWVGETIDALLTEPEHLVARFEPKILSGRMTLSDNFRTLAYDRQVAIGKVTP